jgi:hypothetical protein
MVAFEIRDLGQVNGIDEHETGERAADDGQHQQDEQGDAAGDFPAARGRGAEGRAEAAGRVTGPGYASRG